MEGGHPLVVMGSAYLHDIGIHEVERKYGSTAGQHQEKEGPPVAREILKKLNVQPEIIDEICDIVGHHHSPRMEESLNFQILYEADWLVNMDEEGISKDRQKAAKVVERVFQTVTGKKLAREIYLVAPQAAKSVGEVIERRDPEG